MADCACLGFVRRAVAQICHSVGWNCISQSAHDTLTDVLLLHVENAAKIAQNCSQQCSRAKPAVEDIAFSFRQLNVDFSKCIPQEEITMDEGGISAVWSKVPGAFFTELNQEESSLAIVDRDELKTAKDIFCSVADESNYPSLQATNHHDELERGLEHEKVNVCAENAALSSLASTSPRDSNGMQPIVHTTEIADPWLWPSLVNVLDVTDDGSSNVVKPMSTDLNKEAEERKLDVDFVEVHPPIDQMKRASQVGGTTSEEVTSGVSVKGSPFKIPKLKVKVGSHAPPTSSAKEAHQPGMTSSVAKDQKAKKKKRKNKDTDDLRASGRLPKKSKHKEKNAVPPHAIVPVHSVGNTTITAIPPMAYQSGVQHGLQSFPSQSSVVSQTIPFEHHEATAIQSSEYHCPVCHQADMEGVPWITCDRCNNDVWYHL
jgi:hypothetical protein